MKFYRYFVIFALVCSSNVLSANDTSSQCPTISTFYGDLTVCEPVIHEIIASKVMQRLKAVNQYGIEKEICHTEQYNRFDHSLGVFYLLRVQGRSLGEQLAGLLHDASHTAFSHLGDVFHNHVDGKSSYQDSIHLEFLKKHGIAEILHKYGLKLSDVDHKKSEYNALEQELPDTCADRLDYNIQGAYYSKVINFQEAKEMAKDLQFSDGKWSFSKLEFAKKLSRYSIHMSKHCWSSAEGYLANLYLSKALKRAIDLGHITAPEVEFGTDAHLLEKLNFINDALITAQLENIQRLPNGIEYSTAHPDAIEIPTKFRGIDPYIREGSHAIGRLTTLDQCYRSEFLREKNSFTQPLFVLQK